MKKYLYIELEEGDRFARDSRGFLLVKAADGLRFESAEKDADLNGRFLALGPYLRMKQEESLAWTDYKSVGFQPKEKQFKP